MHTETPAINEQKAEARTHKSDLHNGLDAPRSSSGCKHTQICLEEVSSAPCLVTVLGMSFQSPNITSHF